MWGGGCVWWGGALCGRPPCFFARRTSIHGREFGCTYADTFPLTHLTSRHAIFLCFQLDQRERSVELLIKFLGFVLREFCPLFVCIRQQFAFQFFGSIYEQEIRQHKLRLSSLRISTSRSQPVGA